METQDESFSVEPVQQMFSAVVDMVVAENDGQQGRNGLLNEIKKGAVELHGEREQVESLTGYCQQEISQLKEQIYRSHEEQLTRITEMVELKLKETTQRLEQQLGEEQAARSKAEKFVQMEQMKSIDEIHKLIESLERAQKETEELRERTASDAILEMGKDRLKKKGKELYRLTLPSTPHGELLLAQGKQVPEDLETSPTHDDEGDQEISSTHDEEDQETLSSHDDEEEAEEAAQLEISQLQGEETEETHLTQSEASRYARGRKSGRARWRAVVGPSDISPIPGGPIDESILIDFRSHVAHAIWGGQERKALKLQHHHRNLLEWDITKECKKVREKLQKSALMNLKDYCFKYVDNVLISAFIERWQPETNTFHLPFGEMTITLDDVSHILGIPVEGRPVAGPGGNIPDLKIMELLTKGLGVTAEEAAKETKRASAVRMSWIRDHCKGTTEKSDDARVDACVRGYILYLFGCTVFSDKTGTKISVYHLQNLMEVDKIHTFSWGSAVLGYLYRQLGLASRAKVQHMSGCLTLLQTWIHEHFQLGRAIPQSSYDETMPRATRWQSKQGGGLKEASIEAIREQLDDISRTSVVWDPYKGHRQQHPLKDVAYFKGCLICYDVVEPNHPDRVLRQFGRVQLVPQPPSRPNTISTHDYNLLAGYLQNWVDHLLSVERRSVLVGDEWDCSSNYMSWYNKITHRFVQNPARRKSGEMRMEPEVLQDVEAPEDLGSLCMVELIDSSIKLLKHSFELGATVDKASFMNRERQAIKMLEAAKLLAEHKSKSKYDAVRLKRPSSTWEEPEIAEPIQAKRPKPKRKNKKISALNR